MDIYNKLMSDGYYIGSTYDIFTKEECYYLERVIASEVELGFDTKNEDNDPKWKYRLTASYPVYDVNNNLPLEHHQIKEKQQYLKEANIRIDQQWYYIEYQDIKQVRPKLSYAKDRIAKFISSIYNTGTEVNVIPLLTTVYQLNDFIDPHRDGQNENRLCALLIYLGSPDNYDSSKGGRLFLQPKDVIFHSNKSSIYDMTVSVDPVRPNYVLLDFTKHNLIHAVEAVRENFNRFSLLCFPTIVPT